MIVDRGKKLMRLQLATKTGIPEKKLTRRIAHESLGAAVADILINPTPDEIASKLSLRILDKKLNLVTRLLHREKYQPGEWRRKASSSLTSLINRWRG